jgi:hypothetical protein
MSPLRLNGSTSGYSQIDAPAAAGDQTFTLPTTGGTLDRINRAGNILQVVNGTYSTVTSSSSGTYADTGLSATITPTSASSKILVLVNLNGVLKTTNDTSVGAKLVRGSTDILTFEGSGAGDGTASTRSAASSSTCFLDSPATTSSTTYKVQFRSNSSNASVSINSNAGGSSLTTSTITLIEVAA